MGRLHFSHNWRWNKKLDWANHFGQVFVYIHKKYPRSMRLNFFDHRTLFWTPNRQFQSNCAHFWWAVSTLAIIRVEKKVGLSEPFWTGFHLFPKKVSKLFRSANMVLVIKSSTLVQMCSFFVGRLHFSVNWGWNKKWTERVILDKFLLISRKNYPNFFDHRTLFWTPNRQF